MLRGEHLRSRVALFLALFAFACSDPAIAAMLCPRAADCAQHERAVRTQTPTPISLSIAAIRPCCPMHREMPAQPPIDAANCCAWSATDSSVPTPSFTSRQPRMNDLLALPSIPLLILARSVGSSLTISESGERYLKPVHQKKTDLRI
jgi:hypothetical protein